MSGEDQPVVYWDTNVFISLFRGCTDRKPDEIRGITYWRELADARKATIVTSTLTYGEVLTFDLTAEQYKTFEAFMAARVEVKDPSPRVMRKVRQLREHYLTVPKRKGQKHTLCLPDAIHLATAILFDCQEFHTFDEKHKRRCTGLLKLGPLPDGGGPEICKPTAPPPPSPPPQNEIWEGLPAPVATKRGRQRGT